MKIGIKRKEIMQATGAKPWHVDHLRLTGKLPILIYSEGPGNPVIYDKSAIDIVRKYLERRSVLKSKSQS